VVKPLGEHDELYDEGLRLSVTRKLLAISEEHGATLHIAGSGPGAGPFEWRMLRAARTRPGDPAVAEPPAASPDGSTTVLTLVAPAGPYDAASVLQLCNILADGPVAVRGLSVRGLGEIPVISIVLQPARAPGRAAGPLQPSGLPMAGREAVEALARLLDLDTRSNLLDAALRRQAVMMTTFPTAPTPSPWPQAATLVVQWRCRTGHPGKDSHPDPLAAVTEDLAAQDIPCRVLHARVRADEDHWTMGRARLMLRTEKHLASLAKSTQDRVRDQLLRKFDLRPHECQLALVRHEWWLTRL
jgi:hypothetical protein